MSVSSRRNNKNWDVYFEDRIVRSCECGEGKIVDVYEVASHEKVIRTEQEYVGREVRCKNPLCPSVMKKSQ